LLKNLKEVYGHRLTKIILYGKKGTLNIICETMKLEEIYPDRIIDRGEGYTHYVNYCVKIGKHLFSEVEGTSTYKTKVNLNTLEGTCSCPYHQNCKHAVATYLVYQQGNYVNADKFLEYLQTLSKQELIEIIEQSLQYNPEIALNHNLKTATNFDSFINDFIDDFSYVKMKKAEKLGPYFSFNQLIKILQFLNENEDDIYQILYDDFRTGDEEEPLSNLISSLKEEIIKKISNKKELEKVLKMRYFDYDIIENAEVLSKYKDIIKSDFSKEMFLSFLLNLDGPDMDEIKESITNDNKRMIYSLPSRNIVLAEKLANYLQNKSLLFLVAVYKEDYKGVIEHLSEFDKLFSEGYYFLEKKLSDIVDLFMKNDFKDENTVKIFLKRELLQNYNDKQLKYLIGQIDDIEYIKQFINFEEYFSKNKPLLERLFQLDYNAATAFLTKEKKILENKYWTELIDILTFLKEKFGKEYVINLIKDNKYLFSKSSHLKSNLKKKGIYISNIKGAINVDIKN